MTDIYADVILFDSIGSPYDGNTMHKCGMGGSEFQAILLLEELAKEGYKVICLNNSNKESFVNGVLYAPNNLIDIHKFKCKNLIIHRYSEIPKIAHKKSIHVGNRFEWRTQFKIL